MKHGIRVIDSDTHVNPSMDVLLRYADAALRDRMADLAPYLRKVKVSPGRGDAEDQGQATILSIKQLRYARVAGAKPSAPTGPEGDRGFLSARTHMVTRQPITARVADDNARGRLADMDTEAATSTSSSPARGRTARQRSLPTSRGGWSTPITVTWRNTARRTRAV